MVKSTRQINNTGYEKLAELAEIALGQYPDSPVSKDHVIPYSQVTMCGKNYNFLMFLIQDF